VTGGQHLLALAFEDWARDNTVRAFFLGWGAAVAVWLILDWLGNPNRGRFRAEGPLRSRGVRGRIVAWGAQRDRRDAEVREALRATYGRSSLRLTWSNLDETTATAYDEAHLSAVPRLLELGAASSVDEPTLRTAALEQSWDGSDGVEIDLTDTPAVHSADIDLTDTPATPAAHTADIDLTDTPITPAAARVEPHRAPVAVAERSEEAEPENGWRLGDDPTSPTPAGATPTRTTVRSRAWKNAARYRHAVGRKNQGRMTKGRPPRRWNPITRTAETAKIDLDKATFAVTWTMTGTDPYADEHNRPGDSARRDDAVR
jgi:hypothetical protein